MLEIKSIQIQNFLSYSAAPTTLNFDDFKSLVVSGGNGCGKSTLVVEAIHYALFGKPYREDLKLDELINSINRKAMVVELVFKSRGKTVTVTRGLKPKIFKITVDGEEVKEEVSKKGLQESLIELMEFDPDLFRSQAILDSTYHSPFMDLTTKERREIVDKIFGLGDVTKMLLVSREDKASAVEKEKNLTRDISLLNEKIKLYSQTAKENLERQIEKNREEIATLSSKVQVSTESIQRRKNDVEVLNRNIQLIQTQELKPITDRMDAENKELQTCLSQKAVAESRLEDVKRGKIDDERLVTNTQVLTENRIKVQAMIVEKNTIGSDGCEKTKEIRDTMSSLVATIADDEKIIKDIEAGNLADPKVVDINQNLVESKLKIKTLNEELTLVQGGKCPTCKRDFESVDDHVTKINGEINALTNTIVELVKAKADYNERLLSINKRHIDQMVNLLSVASTTKTELEAKLKADVDKAIDEISTAMQSVLEENKTIKENALGMAQNRLEGAVTVVQLQENKVNEIFSLVNKVQQKIEDAFSSIRTIENSNAILQAGIIDCETRISVAIHNILDLQAKLNEPDTEAEKLKTELETKKHEYAETDREIRALKEAESILSETGIRKFVMEKYLVRFNETLKKYLRIMGADFMFVFDSEFNEVVDDRFRSSYSYASLSTGQKARVNFAITFALMEFSEMRSNTKTNFLVLDEMLESGLDNEGKQAILGIITTQIKKKVIAISHDPLIQEHFHRILNVTRVGGFSKATMT